MSKGSEWQLIALAFALLIVGIFVAVDVQKIVGIVIVCVAAAIMIPVRLMH